MTTFMEIVRSISNDPNFIGGLITYMDDNRLYHIYTTIMSICREAIHRYIKLLAIYGQEAYEESIDLARLCRAFVTRYLVRWRQ